MKHEVAGMSETKTLAEGSFARPAESDWHRMISEAAYYIAEKRGFTPGDPDQDWLEAEAAVRAALDAA